MSVFISTYTHAKSHDIDTRFASIRNARLHQSRADDNFDNIVLNQEPTNQWQVKKHRLPTVNRLTNEKNKRTKSLNVFHPYGSFLWLQASLDKFIITQCITLACINFNIVFNLIAIFDRFWSLQNINNRWQQISTQPYSATPTIHCYHSAKLTVYTSPLRLAYCHWFQLKFALKLRECTQQNARSLCFRQPHNYGGAAVGVYVCAYASSMCR